MDPEEGNRRTIATEGPVYPAGALGRLVVDRGLERGDEVSLKVFDETALELEDVRVRVLGETSVEAAESTYATLHVEFQRSGITIGTWLDESGLVVREEMPPGMVSVRVRPGYRTEAGRGTVDLLRMFRVF